MGELGRMRAGRVTVAMSHARVQSVNATCCAGAWAGSAAAPPGTPSQWSCGDSNIRLCSPVGTKQSRRFLGYWDHEADSRRSGGARGHTHMLWQLQTENLDSDGSEKSVTLLRGHVGI